VIFVTLADTDRAKRPVAETGAVGVRDAVHAAVTLDNDVPEIATFDRGFDSIAGVRRVRLAPGA
jgi:predicted nucleic acid-binding protein